MSIRLKPNPATVKRVFPTTLHPAESNILKNKTTKKEKKKEKSKKISKDSVFFDDVATGRWSRCRRCHIDKSPMEEAVGLLFFVSMAFIGPDRLVFPGASGSATKIEVAEPYSYNGYFLIRIVKQYQVYITVVQQP